MPRHMGTCFRFYKQMRVEKNPKHLPIKSIVTSHNSVFLYVVYMAKKPIFLFQFSTFFAQLAPTWSLEKYCFVAVKWMKLQTFCGCKQSHISRVE